MAGIYKLESILPRYVGVDCGGPDFSTEVEVIFHKDGTIEIVDIRQTPPEKTPDR